MKSNPAKTKTRKADTVMPKETTSTRKIAAYSVGGLSAAVVYATAMELFIVAVETAFAFSAFTGFFVYLVMVLLLVWSCVSTFNSATNYVLSGRIDHDIKRVRTWFGGLRHA